MIFLSPFGFIRLICFSRITKTKNTKKKKAKVLFDHDDFQRAKVAKWAIANSIRPAAIKFDIPESKIRGMTEDLQGSNCQKKREEQKVCFLRKSIKRSLQ